MVAPHVGILKVGLELFIKEGPAAVEMAHGLGAKVFLDLKLHDIPATVERAVSTAVDLGVDYLTLHACGGPGMLRQAVARVQNRHSALRLLAVTVLTSMDRADLEATGVAADPAAQVSRLARLAIDEGVSGLVCSAQELGPLRSEFGADPILVTPGIRPRGSDAGDQKRVATPAEAIRAGASLIVVGRPIRDATDPAAAAQAIAAEVHAAG